jgi:hypothetical protein
MTSLQTRIKQLPSEGATFVSLGNPAGLTNILAFTPNSDASRVGSFAPVTIAANAAAETASALTLTSLGNISTAGALLRDMGKTVISSGRTFRKVQYVKPGSSDTSATVPGNGLTFGVDGEATAFRSFYIELGAGASGFRVARV